MLFVSLLPADPAEGFHATAKLPQRQNSFSGSYRRHNIDSKRGVNTLVRQKSTWLHSSGNLKGKSNETAKISPITSISHDIKTNPTKAIYFSYLMVLCGATLGPFLDSYHSLFGVLTYNTPLIYPIIRWNADDSVLTCVTTYWVPPLFGLAGFTIGWLYILFDALFEVKENETSRFRSQLYPAIPKVLIGISYFTFQYWLSGVLFAYHFDRTLILILITSVAVGGFYALDMTLSGFLVSTATAIGGPLVEIGLLSFLPETWTYHYNDSGETGYFPFWIIPVYFLGGPANGNLARFIWNTLGDNELFAGETDRQVRMPLLTRTSCPVCQGTRAVPCPNCDDGTYITYGQRVICRACRGKGRVICRSCFDKYRDDPNDVENIRRTMDQIPD